jgi:hypothetical protein
MGRKLDTTKIALFKPKDILVTPGWRTVTRIPRPVKQQGFLSRDNISARRDQGHS